VRVEGDTAWATWVNRGSVEGAEGKRAVVWHESAVASRIEGAWRLRFLHSTRISIEGPPEPSPEEIEAALVRQAEAWDRAIVLKNRTAIEANLADDFRQIGGDGTVADRAAFVEGLLDPRLEIDPYTVEELSVRRFGDVALLSGRTRMTGRWEGEPFTSHYRYVDVYLRRDGVWRVVSVQITRLTE
jgi:ketosteroid isomerase-like protein